MSSRDGKTTNRPADGPPWVKEETDAGRWIRSLRLVLGLACAVRLGAVPPPPVPLEREAPWRIADFARDAGVARRMVFDVAFTPDHTAWFAASDGLHRFDGYRWHRFTTADGLPSNLIRTVSVTRDGTLWIGTDRGAGVFDGREFNRRGTEERLAGPNVRRIVETADGTLWFCCDRWPDATVPGGLTRVQGAEAHSYRTGDGLPSDHVLGLFEQSNHRLIALTSAGPAVRDGATWGPLTDDGYPAGNLTWAMAETPDGLVFAQGFEQTLVLREGRWSPCNEPRGSTTAPICVGPDGALVLGVRPAADVLAFARWDGESFARASAEVATPGVDELSLRAAPDGAIWAVGRGTILRWEYLPGAWGWWPELPPPRLEDREGRLWFAGRTNAVLLAGGRFRDLPELRWPLVEDPGNGVWAASDSGLAHWQKDDVERVSPEVSGIHTLLGGVADVAGGVWLHGKDAAGESVVARWHAGDWSAYTSRALEGRTLVSWSADPRTGVWAVLNDEDSGAYELARFTAEGMGAVPMEGDQPRIHRPSICASQTHLYLFGYTGLWASPLGETLTFAKVEPHGNAVFAGAASAGELTAFIAQEGPTGSAAILLRRGDDWLHHPAAYGQGLWLGGEGWMMVADGPEFMQWQAREWHSPAYVSLPTDTTVLSMVRSGLGEYWLGTSEGVLHLQPRATLPDTLLSGPATLVAGEPAVVQARGVARFTPKSRRGRFSFTWRIDDQSWSGYADWPAAGVSLAGLAPGSHVVEARARDGLGNEDPTPARWPVEVRPVPIQDRHWFRPGLAAAGLAFAGLSLSLYGAARRLGRHATGLKRQVEARTAELQADLERRERVEQALRESEERYRRIVETAHEGIWCLDAESRTFFVNHRLEEMLGYRAGQMLGRPLTDFLRPEDAADRLAAMEGRRPGPADPLECRYRHAQGGWRWMGVSATPQYDAQGQFLGSFAMLTDITARKQTEEALLASEERARRQRAALAGLVLDGAMASSEVPAALRRVTEVLADTMGVGRASVWLLSGDSPELRCEELFTASGRVHSRGGTLRTADCPCYFEALRAESRIAVERAQADARTRELTATYLGPLEIESLLNAGIQIEGRLVGMVCLEQVGVARRWHSDEEAFASTVAAMVAQILVNTQRKQAESEREKLQGQLLQAQKLESVGRLAGGVAHDFNNMLQAILGHADLTLQALPPDSPLREDVGEIQRSAQRSAELTRQLLAFARRQTIVPRLLDLNDTVAGMMKMLRRLMREDIDLAWLPGADLGPVRMDPSQVDQILANLCVNARDAIAGAGRVTIATDNVTLDANTPGLLDATPGPYVMLEVSDTGRGMDAETCAHLFEPYFTTKESGQGSGLGLATVFGIVRQNAGWISVTSAPAQGTRFTLYLPRAVATPADTNDATSPPLTGTETVLLVEDEEQILTLGRRALTHYGYTVLAAPTPEAALAAAANHPGPIDLLVTDVIMPGMNGRELCERLQDRYPGLKCLFMSGYTADVIAPHGVLAPGTEFLPKPFNVQTLAARVRAMLGNGGRPPT